MNFYHLFFCQTEKVVRESPESRGLGDVEKRKGGWTPRKCTGTHTPRVTGEVSTPFALTVSTAAMPSRPPRWLLPLRLTF